MLIYSSSRFSSLGLSFSRGVGEKLEFALELSVLYPPARGGTVKLFCCASSAASLRDIAEAFFRPDLNWNFLGGANSVRTAWRFEESPFTPSLKERTS